MSGLSPRYGASKEISSDFFSFDGGFSPNFASCARKSATVRVSNWDDELERNRRGSDVEVAGHAMHEAITQLKRALTMLCADGEDFVVHTQRSGGAGELGDAFFDAAVGVGAEYFVDV